MKNHELEYDSRVLVPSVNLVFQDFQCHLLKLNKLEYKITFFSLMCAIWNIFYLLEMDELIVW